MTERDDVSNIGIGPLTETFKIDDSTITYDATKENGSDQVDLAVTFSAANTVALVADGEAVVGKLLKVESDNMATVQTRGVVTLPGGTSATLTLGSQIVGDLLVSAEGYIRSAASGTAAELILCRGMIQDAGTTTAVVVLL